MNCLVAAVFALAAFCGTAEAGISFEEEIPAFRRGVDAWRIDDDYKYLLIAILGFRRCFAIDYKCNIMIQLRHKRRDEREELFLWAQ